MKTTEKNNQKSLNEAIANAANACKVICTINTRFAQHGIPMLVIGESHSIMGEKGNRTLCIDRDDLALLNAIGMRETLKIDDLAVKIKQRGSYPYPLSMLFSAATPDGECNGRI